VENDNINYRFSKERLILLAIVLIIVWGSLLTFWYFKADEITRDPCSICAERMGEKVTCRINNYSPLAPTPERNYYPNGSTLDVNNPLTK